MKTKDSGAKTYSMLKLYRIIIYEAAVPIDVIWHYSELIYFATVKNLLTNQRIRKHYMTSGRLLSINTNDILFLFGLILKINIPSFSSWCTLFSFLPRSSSRLSVSHFFLYVVNQNLSDINISHTFSLHALTGFPAANARWSLFMSTWS